MRHHQKAFQSHGQVDIGWLRRSAGASGGWGRRGGEEGGGGGGVAQARTAVANQGSGGYRASNCQPRRPVLFNVSSHVFTPHRRSAFFHQLSNAGLAFFLSPPAYTNTPVVIRCIVVDGWHVGQHHVQVTARYLLTAFVGFLSSTWPPGVSVNRRILHARGHHR